MRNRTPLILAAAAVSCFALASKDAHAQGTTVIVQGQQPPPGVVVQQVPPGYAPGYAPPGYAPGYTTPIYQETQPAYVPQSVAMSGPRVIKDWNEGDPIPAGYHPATRVKKGWIIGGAVTFGTVYLITALGASVADAASNNSATPLFIPVAGPFIQMGNCGSGGCGPVGDFWLGFDGVVQGAGLAMLIYGIASPSTVLVRNDLGENIKPKAPKLALQPVPVVTPTMQGMGVIGTF